MEEQDLVYEIARQLSLDPVMSVDGVIWYGSRHPEGDIDLCIVFEGPIRMQSFNLGRLDLAAFSRKDFEFYLYHFDPIAVEPLLSGSIVQEMTTYLTEKKKEIASLRSSPEIVSYLLRRSVEEYLNARAYFYQLRQVADPFVFRVRTLINLSFAWAYNSYARYYYHHAESQPITLQDLIEASSDSRLGDLLEVVRKSKRRLVEMENEEIENWLGAYESLLLK